MNKILIITLTALMIALSANAGTDEENNLSKKKS